MSETVEKDRPCAEHKRALRQVLKHALETVQADPQTEKTVRAALGALDKSDPEVRRSLLKCLRALARYPESAPKHVLASFVSGTAEPVAGAQTAYAQTYTWDHFAAQCAPEQEANPFRCLAHAEPASRQAAVEVLALTVDLCEMCSDQSNLYQNFLAGAGSLVEIVPRHSLRLHWLRPRCVMDAWRSDWMKIAADLRKAIAAYDDRESQDDGPKKPQE